MTLHRRHFLHQTALGGMLALSGTVNGGPDSSPKKRPVVSPFLQGNFAPVREEVTFESLKVIGSLPKELEGMFVRNGPNPQFAPKGGYHWFDGDGMLHGVVFRDGKASYLNRYVRTIGWQEENKAGKALYGGLMDPPDIKKMLAGKFDELYKNVANTSLVWHHGKLLALWEGGDAYEVKVPKLETVGPYRFNVKKLHPWSAHPKIDPVTREMIGFGYSPMKPYVSCSVVDPKGNLLTTVPIDLPRPIMMHDFAITSHYLLFMDLPQTFSFQRMLKGEPIMKFEPEYGARFGLLSRKELTAKIRWFESKTCFVFHTLNAFETDDQVTLIGCRYQRFPDVLQTTEEPGKAQPNVPVLYRWIFDLKSGKTREEPLDEIPTEFPRINEQFLGRAMRFGYAGHAEQDMFVAFRKYDLQTNKVQSHSFGKGRYGGEGVFVPRQGGVEEDDGWLMTYLYDRANDKSELVIIDTRDFTANPVARVLLPVRVPYGFHGTWIPGPLPN